MVIKVTDAIEINISDEKIISWSQDNITGIITVNLTDGSTWKYLSETKEFYKLETWYAILNKSKELLENEWL